MGNDAAATEEISQHNQRARRDGAIEDPDSDVLAVEKLHGAHSVAGRRQPDGLDVEGASTAGSRPMGAPTPRRTGPSTWP